MKRDALNHSKMKRLCRKLDIPVYQGVGILESLWHITATEAWRGDIGKLSNEDIAIAIDYRGDEDQLIAALVSSGWLDESKEHRLVVHDWQDHAAEWLQKRAKRSEMSGQIGFLSDNDGNVPPGDDNGSLPSLAKPSQAKPEPGPDPAKPDPPSSASQTPRAETREREIVESIFGFYCEKFQKNPKRYQLTDERRKKAGLRFRERLKANGGNEAAVEVEFSQAVENLAASEYHMANGYTDWLAQIFRSQEEFEKRLNWKQERGHSGNTNGSNSESVFDRIQRQRGEAGTGAVGSGDASGDGRKTDEPEAGAALVASSDELPW